jgi:hypothetical protein
MPYFSKNGSVPKTTIDNTPGWILVPNPPTNIPEGKQLVWLNWEWVVREFKPEDREGYQWNWDHDTKSWIEYPLPETLNSIPIEEQSQQYVSIDGNV